MGQTYRKMYLLVSQKKEKDFEIRTFLFGYSSRLSNELPHLPRSI